MFIKIFRSDTDVVVHVHVHVDGVRLLTGKTKELGEKSMPVTLCQQKSHMDRPKCKPSFHDEKLTTKHLSHGMAWI
jgi:hypothetical protein